MKKILITGAGTGIGRAATEALAKKGHHVYPTTVDEDQARELNELGKKEGWKLDAFKLDVTNEADRQKAGELELDVLYNNAGVGFSGSSLELDVDKIRLNMEVNVFSAIRLSQIVAKGMIERQKGTLLYTSSIGGRIPFPWLASYCMTKYALEALAETLRVELEMLDKNVHVALIEPGPYKTGFNQSILGNKFDWMQSGSYWQDKIDFMKKDDDEKLAEMESTDLSDLIEKVVQACEADTPELRYFAPESWLPIVKEAETAR